MMERFARAFVLWRLRAGGSATFVFI